MAEGVLSHSYVYMASVLTLLRAIAVLSFINPTAVQQVAGANYSAETQVFAASLALAGVPMFLMANFGMAWRIEVYVRRFCTYLIGAAAVDCFLLMVIPAGADMCAAVTNPYVIANGRIFVCTFVNASYFFWMAVIASFECYLVYKVREQADILRSGEFAELIRYATGKGGEAERFAAG
mmetsp:Transcript_85457/g.151108  ORF Transcript_85457/g.151108 Transcript_85457/m.151108 type:complete len:179 (-) Transcript_85457:46-582(-)